MKDRDVEFGIYVYVRRFEFIHFVTFDDCVSVFVGCFFFYFLTNNFK